MNIASVVEFTGEFKLDRSSPLAWSGQARLRSNGATYPGIHAGVSERSRR